MGTPFNGVYIVTVGENIFAVGIVVLKGNFHLYIVFFVLNVNGFVQRGPVLVQILHKFYQSAFVEEHLLGVVPFIPKHNFQAPVQKGQFPQPRRQGFLVKFNLFENFRIGPKGGFGAGFAGFAHFFHLGYRNAALVLLAPHRAIPVHFHFAPFRKGVHHGSTHPVQPAGYFVGIFVEFTTGVQHGHNNFQCGFIHFPMLIHRDTAAIVFYSNAFIGMNGDDHLGTEASHGFINAVVHNFVHQMVQSPTGNIPDVHGGPFAHRLQPF